MEAQLTNWIILAVYAFGAVLGYKAVKREYLNNRANHATPGVAIGIGLFWPAVWQSCSSSSSSPGDGRTCSKRSKASGPRSGMEK
jgi:hypothetical protein